MPHDTTLTDALDRLHHAINERRKASKVIKVSVADLQVVLQDYHAMAARELTGDPP